MPVFAQKTSLIGPDKGKDRRHSAFYSRLAGIDAKVVIFLFAPLHPGIMAVIAGAFFIGFHNMPAQLIFLHVQHGAFPADPVLKLPVKEDLDDVSSIEHIIRAAAHDHAGALIRQLPDDLRLAEKDPVAHRLLIHGIASDAEYYNESAQVLADKYHVITYNRPGYSRSKAGTDAGTVPGQALQTKEMLDMLAPEGTYIAASSAGCLIAYELAARWPDMVKGMLLYEPPLSKDAKILQPFPELAKVLKTMNEKKRMAKSLMMFINVSGGYDETAKSEPMKQQQQNFINYQYFLDNEMESLLGYAGGSIPEICVPAAIAVGDMDEKGLFNRAGTTFAEAMGYPLIQVHGYHNFPKDRPQEFAELVSRMIRRHAACSSEK